MQFKKNFVVFVITAVLSSAVSAIPLPDSDIVSGTDALFDKGITATGVDFARKPLYQGTGDPSSWFWLTRPQWEPEGLWAALADVAAVGPETPWGRAATALAPEAVARVGLVTISKLAATAPVLGDAAALVVVAIWKLVVTTLAPAAEAEAALASPGTFKLAATVPTPAVEAIATHAAISTLAVMVPTPADATRARTAAAAAWRLAATAPDPAAAPEVLSGSVC
ncbi:hypothetical protein BV20DRAFT_1054009 [Pilatotrama ljubarskyi]|nr:hypothetical protein BV20DRAFT_1054009 [Pilatotrama ljubarskyi]